MRVIPSDYIYNKIKGGDRIMLKDMIRILSFLRNMLFADLDIETRFICSVGEQD